MSLIGIEGMEFFAYHGYYEKERKVGGYYVVDVYITTNFDVAAQTDKLVGTVNYEEVFDVCKKIVGQPVKLIEHLAHKILIQLSEEINEVQKIKVRVIKKSPPLTGKVQQTFVEIEKSFV